MKTMKAAVFETTGEPAAVITLREVSVPAPGRGETLVKIDAGTIQPADFMFIGGRYRIKPQPSQIAGLEGTGVVVEAGPEVAVRVGERVAFRSPGSWAEYALVPAERLHPVPPDISTGDAAQFPLNPVTAWALLDEVRPKAGDWIAINAATSTVAQLVAGLARRRGVRVFGLVRAGGQVPLEFPTLSSDTAGLAEQMLVLSGGAAFAGLFDSIGGPAIMTVLPALRPGATIVSYGVLQPEPAPMRNADLIYRNLTWKGFGIDRWLANSGGPPAAMTAELWDAIRRRELVLPVRARYRLEEIQAALTDASSHGRAGKVLVVT